MADAGSESDVKAFIDKAVEHSGEFDAIWANAGSRRRAGYRWPNRPSNIGRKCSASI